jgi:hypothetical protein
MTEKKARRQAKKAETKRAVLAVKSGVRCGQPVGHGAGKVSTQDSP